VADSTGNTGAHPNADAIARGVFFIIGTGRSGTTLVQSMLMSHSRIFLPPETRYFGVTDPDLILGAGQRKPGDLDRYLAAAWPDWSRREFGLDEAEVRSAIAATDLSTRAVFLALAGLWSARSGKPRIGEKTPNHEKSVARIRAVFPEARFIQILRDPRDVVVSKRDHQLQGHASIFRYARSMRKVYDRHAEYVRTLPKDVYLTVRYEDLVSDPEGQVRTMCAFLGEEFEPAMVRPHERASKGFAGFEAGWKDLTLQPLTLSRIGRYREKLTPREIRTVERAVGHHLQELGYTPEPGIPHRLDWAIADAGAYLGWRVRRNLTRAE